jgi:hypothetical protein
MILDILRAEEVMNAWIVVMIILLGIGALTLHRYDVWRILIWTRLVPAGRVSARLQGRAPVRLDRNDIGRMKISRPLIWALQLTLVLLWLAAVLKSSMIAGVLGLVVLALTLWVWVQAERDVRRWSKRPR